MYMCFVPSVYADLRSCIQWRAVPAKEWKLNMCEGGGNVNFAGASLA